MDSISTARDFFINQQGLSPDQADMIVSKGMEAYNQQSQPQQNMMQMASGGIARLGYQMGGSPMGVGTMPMDYGQSLQVPQQMPTNFSSAQNITMNPLLNYGQPQLGQAGGTPLTMAGGGISRLGYQEGGMGMEMMQPQMQDQMMQPPMQDQMQPNQEQQTAILTIIQLLIEQGIDPETAKELAARILEAFAQGGEPAVEALANQLGQEEGMQQPMMMAEGGLTSIDRARDMLQSRAPRGEFLAYINPQEAGILKLMGGAGQDVNVRGVPSFFNPFKAAKSVVKSVVNVVKDVAKSPIGQIALAIAAPYAIGAMFPAFATLGTASLGTFGGAALRAGISNLAIQGITTGKFDPKQALIAGLAGGALSGLTGPASAAANIDPSTGLPIDSITGTITQPSIGSLESNLLQGYKVPISTPGITGTITQPSSFFSPTEYGSALSKAIPTGLESDISSMVGTGKYAPFTLDKATLDPAAGAGSQIYNPGVVQTEPNIFQKGITSVQDFGTKLMSDPIGTIGSGVKSAYDYASQNKGEALLAATAALGALTPQQPGEPDSSYEQRKAEYDAEVARYITQYGGGTKLYSPSFYAMEGAVDPFAGRSTYAAMGGRIGYEGGSMPMGEPRRNQVGIMELDYRKEGGFVPPIGIKEKADDIPAMLSNNEFVFTANAVRNAGGGNVNKGAERMYGLMKQLEAGGVA